MATHQFKPALAATLAVAVLLPLFTSLGFWQLRRAEEKTALMRQREARQQEPALSAAALAGADHRYRRAELAGSWDAAHQFLLDNQIFKQQAGYGVLTPLRIDGQDFAVLVNRGWVPVGPDRRKLPDVPPSPAQHVLVRGLVDHYPGVGFKLQGAEIPAPGWPSVVQLLDAERLSERLGYRLLPYQVLLAPNEPGGYARDWQPPSLNPEKNRGYALQWFAFAAVSAGLYLWFGFRRRPGM